MNAELLSSGNCKVGRGRLRKTSEKNASGLLESVIYNGKSVGWSTFSKNSSLAPPERRLAGEAERDFLD